jgi:hypothetical protein
MNVRFTALLLFALALKTPTLLRAQWTVPGPVVLDGSTPASRQITGLGTAVTADQAISIGDLRAQVATRGQLIADGSVWQLGIDALGGAVLPGTVITFAIPDDPSIAPLLSVNGETPLALLGWRGAPLNGAALLPGRELRVVRGVDRYLVLDALQRACPEGYMAYAPAACIDPAPRAPATFYQAADSCLRAGGRLCSMGEWVAACTLVPGFMDQVSQAEWVDHAANNADRTKVIGIGENGYNGSGTGCDYGGHRLPTAILPYRCCAER